ncbi:Endothelin-converting enzyme 1 [Armadillidium vulgare]|nr:Endothelin-converting enzyme 1 [Armadillidium vulgare]
MPREERRFVHHIHNVMNLTQLYELAPLFNWTDIINKILPDTIEVDDSELVNVGDVRYFGNLTNLLKRTPDRVVANYLMLRGVIQAASFLSKDIRDLDLKFLRTLSGRVTHLPRWEQCIAMVSRSLSYAVSNLYVKHYLQNGSKEKVEVLVRYLRNSFDEMLKGLEWMDDETKKQALKKERAINSYIGYPEELLHDEYISEFYSNITIGKDLLENNLGIAVYNSDFYYSKLRKPIDKFDWRERGAVTLVNAFYNTAKNAIELPAGILQGAFYQADRPHYLNFGAIGFVIGHEITHGFDDQGRQYDMDGNLDDWWQADTEKRFLEKTNCIIEQYGNYTSETHDIKINGIYTQGENIADNGGIRVAYKAYMKWVEDSGKEAMLPGLVYTPNQLFWIASAQIWCSVYRPEFLRNKIISDNHSPENFRVNGPLSNFDKFSEDFKCGANSKMNPEHKCIVW